jgi:hypothetical protein
VRRGVVLRRRAQRGQVIVTVSIAMALFLLGVIALVANVAQLYGAQASLNRAAQDAAESGGAAVNYPVFIATGKLKLLTLPAKPNAESLCEDAGTADLAASWPAAKVKCTVQGPADRVVVATIDLDVPLPIPIVGARVHLRSSYAAAAQAGTNTPNSS